MQYGGFVQRQFATGRSLNNAFCRGGCGERFAQVALRRITRWPRIEHHAFHLEGGHSTTELIAAQLSCRCWQWHVISRESFCCSEKVRKLHLFSTKVAFMRSKLHFCAHLTAKDLTQPIFLCTYLAKSQDFPHFHLPLIEFGHCRTWVGL